VRVKAPDLTPISDLSARVVGGAAVQRHVCNVRVLSEMIRITRQAPSTSYFEYRAVLSGDPVHIEQYMDQHYCTSTFANRGARAGSFSSPARIILRSGVSAAQRHGSRECCASVPL